MKRIDLYLPRGWNSCTTEDLETIAAAFISEQECVGRYHPFDWNRVKLDIILAANKITIFRAADTPDGDAEHWLLQRPQDDEPWPVSTGQMMDLIKRLDWLDDKNANNIIFAFPYRQLRLERGRWRREYGVEHKDKGVVVQGPPPLLDGYTWREYRWLTDWMQEYMRRSNAKGTEAAAAAQREFLAVLFKGSADTSKSRNADTSAPEEGNIINPALFTDFPPVMWQVILFWWSSLMQQLSKKFPRVFRSQPVGKGKRARRPQQDAPWDFYNRVTATIQKYIGGLSEQDVNNATYGTILQQLEMMADEAAEMEKLKKK